MALQQFSSNFDYRSFDETFSWDPECSYSEDVVREIAKNKKDLEGQFIEKVMKLMGIKRRK